MTENLTTRDVFQQVDTRLGRVEVDVRDLRGEIRDLRGEMNARFDRLFGFLVSLMVGVGALVIGVAGLWLKT